MSKGPSAERPPEITFGALLRSLWNSLHEMRVVLYLLVLLAGGSLLGAVVPQKQAAEYYLTHYGPVLGNLVVWLGLGRLFGSWWFNLLVVLLMVSLVACSRRLLAQAKGRWRLPEAGAIDRRVQTSRQKLEKVLPVLPAAASDALTRAARRHGLGVHLVAADQDGMRVHLSRNRWAWWGTVLAHYSLFLIVIGAVMGAIPGLSVDTQITVPEGHVNLSAAEMAGEMPEGHPAKAAPPELPFQVRLDKFEIRRDPSTGAIENYYSDLTVLENDHEVQRQTISVNRPLKYKGYYLSQADYGVAGVVFEVNVGGKGQSLVFLFARPVHAEELQMGEVPSFTMEGGVKFLGEDLALVATQFVPNAERKGGKVVEVHGMGADKPAVRLMAVSGFKTGQHSNPQELGPVLVGESVPIAGGTAKFVGLCSSTVLGVRKDPGVPVVWLGFIGCLVGMMMIFYVRRESAGAKLEPQGDAATRVRLAWGAGGPSDQASSELWTALMSELSGGPEPEPTAQGGRKRQ